MSIIKEVPLEKKACSGLFGCKLPNKNKYGEGTIAKCDCCGFVYRLVILTGQYGVSYRVWSQAL